MQMLHALLRNMHYLQVKVRARLSRPRQRGKSAKHARGGYPVTHGTSRGYKAQWGSSSSRMDSWRVTGRGGRSMQTRGTYDDGLKRQVGPRDRYPTMEMVPTRVGSRRRLPSPESSFGRRSPGACPDWFDTKYIICLFPLSSAYIYFTLFGCFQFMKRVAQGGSTFNVKNPSLDHLFLLEAPRSGAIIKIVTLHVDLSIWKVLLEMFLVVLVIELRFMKMMTMTDI